MEKQRGTAYRAIKKMRDNANELMQYGDELLKTLDEKPGLDAAFVKAFNIQDPGPAPMVRPHPGMAG